MSVHCSLKGRNRRIKPLRPSTVTFVVEINTVGASYKVDNTDYLLAPQKHACSVCEVAGIRSCVRAGKCVANAAILYLHN